MGRVNRAIRGAIGSLFRRPALSYSYGWKPKQTPLYGKSIAQEASDWARTVGGGMGLFLGPGGEEQAAAKLYPLFHPVARLLALLNLDPYARWRSELRKVLEAKFPGQVTPEQYRRLGQAFGSYFATNRRAGAGYGPSEQAAAMRLLASKNLLPGLYSGDYSTVAYRTGKLLEALGAIEEATGSRDIARNLQLMEKLIGPIGYWHPEDLETAVRAALMRGGG